MLLAKVTLPVVSVNVTVAELTEPEKVTPPDCVIVKVPKAAFPPIALVIPIVPDPALNVKLRVELSLSTVLENVKLSLEDVKVALVLKVTAPE